MIKLVFALSQAMLFPAQNDIYLEIVGDPNTVHSQIFYAPHENESVGNAYVVEKIKQLGGAFIIMRQQGTRNITMHINNKNIYVDPNRIFTRAGIISSIQKLNPTLPSNSTLFNQAVNRAAKLGHFVLNQIANKNKTSTWIAMHNNTEGFAGDHHHGRGDVSILRYQTKLAAGANYLIDVNVDKNHDEDNLFFVTQAKDFHIMRKYHWNVVLQSPLVTSDPDEDDGSLSVYAQMHHIRYINIEAERKDLDFGNNNIKTQREMVDFIYYLTN